MRITMKRGQTFYLILISAAFVLNSCGHGGGGSPSPLVNSSSVTEILKGAASCALGCTTFSGAGITEAYTVVADAFGNIWVTNLANGGSPMVTKILKGARSCFISPVCVTFTGLGTNVTVDTSGNAWVIGNSTSSVLEIPPGATSCLSGCISFTGGGINNPFMVVADLFGNIWVLNTPPLGDRTVTEIPKGSTSCISSCITYSGTAVGSTSNMVPDTGGNIWLVNPGNGGVTEILKGATSCPPGCVIFTGAMFAGLGFGGSGAAAVDSLGNFWVVNSGNNSITEILKGATSCPPGCITFSSANFNLPVGLAGGLAVDVSDNVWVAELGDDSVTEILSGASSCSASCITFTGGGISRPLYIVGDASGNVWVTNLNTVTEILKGATSCPPGCITFSGGGITAPAIPVSIAVDAVGNVWIVSQVSVNSVFPN